MTRFQWNVICRFILFVLAANDPRNLVAGVGILRRMIQDDMESEANLAKEDFRRLIE